MNREKKIQKIFVFHEACGKTNSACNAGSYSRIVLAIWVSKCILWNRASWKYKGFGQPSDVVASYGDQLKT